MQSIRSLTSQGIQSFQELPDQPPVSEEDFSFRLRVASSKQVSQQDMRSNFKKKAVISKFNHPGYDMAAPQESLRRSSSTSRHSQQPKIMKASKLTKRGLFSLSARQKMVTFSVPGTVIESQEGTAPSQTVSSTKKKNEYDLAQYQIPQAKTKQQLFFLGNTLANFNSPLEIPAPQPNTGPSSLQRLEKKLKDQDGSDLDNVKGVTVLKRAKRNEEFKQKFLDVKPIMPSNLLRGVIRMAKDEGDPPKPVEGQKFQVSPEIEELLGDNEHRRFQHKLAEARKEERQKQKVIFTQ